MTERCNSVPNLGSVINQNIGKEVQLCCVRYHYFCLVNNNFPWFCHVSFSIWRRKSTILFWIFQKILFFFIQRVVFVPRVLFSLEMEFTFEMAHFFPILRYFREKIFFKAEIEAVYAQFFGACANIVLILSLALFHVVAYWNWNTDCVTIQSSLRLRELLTHTWWAYTIFFWFDIKRCQS